MTSLPLTMGRMALCWMADGFSKPTKEKKFFYEMVTNSLTSQAQRLLH